MEFLTKKSLQSLPTLMGEFPYPISEKIEEGRKCLTLPIYNQFPCLLKQGFYGVAKFLIKDEYDQTMYNYIVNKKSLPSEEESWYLINYGFYKEAEKYFITLDEERIVDFLLHPEKTKQQEKKFIFKYSWEKIVPVYEKIDIDELWSKDSGISKLIENSFYFDSGKEHLDYFYSRFPNNNNFNILIRHRFSELLKIHNLSYVEDYQTRNKIKRFIKIFFERGASQFLLPRYSLGYNRHTIFSDYITENNLDSIIFFHQLGVKFLPKDLYDALNFFGKKYDIIKYILENSSKKFYNVYSIFANVVYGINSLQFESREKYLKEIVPIFLLLIKYFPDINSTDLKELYKSAIYLEEKYKYSDLLNLLKEKFPSEVLCPNCHLLKNPKEM